MITRLLAVDQVATPRFSESRTIEAAPAEVYAVLADYRDKHPHILPRPPFVSLLVEDGGVGEGTVIRVEMRVMGRTQTFRAVVTEPEPGRILVETTDTGYVTSFIVDPGSKPTQAKVTIATEMPGRKGVLGALEAWMAKRLLLPAYHRELLLLEKMVTGG